MSADCLPPKLLSVNVNLFQIAASVVVVVNGVGVVVGVDMLEYGYCLTDMTGSCCCCCCSFDRAWVFPVAVAYFRLKKILSVVICSSQQEWAKRMLNYIPIDDFTQN